MFIVMRHNLRREINRRRTIAMATRNGRATFIAPAHYARVRNSEPMIIDDMHKLKSIAPNLHDNMESVLYLTVGMPLVLTDNSHTPQGITNGAYATLVDIVLDPADADAADAMPITPITLRRPPAQIIVKLSAVHDKRCQLAGLPEDHVVIEPRKGTATIVEKYRDANNRQRNKNRTYSFHQLPISPAFAVTDYRSQGDTRERVIVDIDTPPFGTIDPAAAYVAISRVTSLEGLAILRDFDVENLRRGMRSSISGEYDRLRVLERSTNARITQVSLVKLS